MKDKNDLAHIVSLFLIILLSVLLFFVLSSCRKRPAADPKEPDHTDQGTVYPDRLTDIKLPQNSETAEENREIVINEFNRTSEDDGREASARIHVIHGYPVIETGKETVPENEDDPGFEIETGNTDVSGQEHQNDHEEPQTDDKEKGDKGPAHDDKTGQESDPKDTSAESIYEEQKSSELVDKPSWRESVVDGVTVRDEFVYHEGVFADETGTKEVVVGDGEVITVAAIENPVKNLRIDYRPVERIISQEVEDYLIGQKVSNRFSHISDPTEIIGTNLTVEGLPFYYVPGFIAGKDISKVEIDFNDKNSDGVLGTVYERCNPRKADAWEIPEDDLLIEYPCAVYVNADHIIDEEIKTLESALIKDYFYERTENHLGITVTRPAQHKVSQSDYFFLAYPLLNGKYVIDLAGGIIVLTKVPERNIHIYFNIGGGELGFFDLQIAVDGKVVYTCEHFRINTVSVVTSQY